jgi:hypothetical protein
MGHRGGAGGIASMAGLLVEPVGNDDGRRSRRNEF